MTKKNMARISTISQNREQDLQRKVNILKKCDLFSKAQDEDDTKYEEMLRSVANGCPAPYSCTATNTLFSREEPADSFFIIESGEFHLETQGRTKKSFYRETRVEGAHIGATSMILASMQGKEHHSRSATATAVINCTVLKIPKELLPVLKRNTQIYEKLIAHIWDRVGELTRLVDVLKQSNEVKVACLILQRASVTDDDSENTKNTFWKVPVSIADIMQEYNLEKRTTTRILDKLFQVGILKKKPLVKDKFLSVSNMAELKKLAESSKHEEGSEDLIESVISS